MKPVNEGLGKKLMALYGYVPLSKAHNPSAVCSSGGVQYPGISVQRNAGAWRTDCHSISEAYRLQERLGLCPCAWTKDSCDTLLISIREAAVGQLLMRTAIQCLGQGQLSRAISDSQGHLGHL